MLENLDLSGLFEDDPEDDYAQGYIFGTLTDEMIKRAEASIGYALPKSYVELLRFQNGGLIADEGGDCWLTAIYGIGEYADAENGLEDMFPNWMEEWEYPNIGIPFGETQSGGHDMYFMDMRNLDADGEPAIVRIDNESPDDVQIHPVAANLREFLEKVLEGEDVG